MHILATPVSPCLLLLNSSRSSRAGAKEGATVSRPTAPVNGRPSLRKARTERSRNLYRLQCSRSCDIGTWPRGALQGSINAQGQPYVAGRCASAAVVLVVSEKRFMAVSLPMDE